MVGRNIVRKLIESHRVQSTEGAGGEGETLVRIDQTLTQDTTGTMAYLQLEALGIDRVKTERSVSYVDHNVLQVGFENADDHNFLQDIAAKYGIIFSRPGNGICHQVHLERFGVPGKTLLGSDSHTPTAGALGMLAIGAGGLDVALAMAGFPFSFPPPRVLRVELKGRLRSMVSAKDIVLEVLRRLTVKGGVGKILEYSGEGVATLSVPQRGTITNMGAELGATTSVFPSDEVTRLFLEAQGRGGDYLPLAADPDAKYDEELVIDLSSLEPLIALPHMPDKVVPVSEAAGRPVDQCFIGSCTNSSYYDLAVSASILKGHHVDPRTSLVVGPGSRQTFLMITRDGILADLVGAGARILECACGPCIGIGQAPRTDGVSLRTSNRNFEGRSGTKSGQVFLVSAETAAASAVRGVITDPREFSGNAPVAVPAHFEADDSMFIFPGVSGKGVEVRRGPNIAPLPEFPPLPGALEGEVLLVMGDNITTDHILPAGSRIMSLRSNLPAISEYCFSAIDPAFPARARAAGGGIVVGGENYGQGSSREHAALSPRFLGLRAVIVKSYARIHRQNLVNAGILPLIFENAGDWATVSAGDRLSIANVAQGLAKDSFEVRNETRGTVFAARHGLSGRQVDILLAGGALNAARRELAGH
ncbi:MAG: aconitate hydratase [Spirochaetae bacterium HGW-Spirochaetae-9]|nr:MAG: aconitate hydratase [Spirochaetae bacterium HGW-Spirochaetae-9]